MGRTGGDKGKGKEPARPSKKSKRVLRDENSEEDDPLYHDETVEEQVDRQQQRGRSLFSSAAASKGKKKPLTLTITFPRVRGQTQRPPETLEWKTGRLSTLEETLRPQWFNAKISYLSDRKDGFLLEKQVILDQFRPFGLVQMFERIGWAAILSVYDGETENIYMDPVQEWMSTLVYTRGDDHPYDDVLAGQVGGKTVIMSFRTLSAIANFDTLSIEYYATPSPEILYRCAGDQPHFSDMQASLYEPDVGADNVGARMFLRMPVRILLLFICKNIMPRRSDLGKVRHPEVAILNSLLTGQHPVSLRYLIMSNIWEARESREKFYIPHVRLITALLKSQGVNVNAYPKTKRKIAMEPFTCASLSAQGLVYSTSRRHLKFFHKDTQRVWKVVRPGMEGAVSDDESMSSGGEVGYRMPVFGELPHMMPPHELPRRHSSVDAFDYGSFVQESRPEEYNQWDSYQQRCWDRDVESNERTSREQRHWNINQEYSFQTEINRRYLTDQQRRMRNQYNAGEEVLLHVPRTDFTSLPRNTTGAWYPEPEAHHSAWIDPYQQQAQWEEMTRARQQQQTGQGSSSEQGGGAFGMSAFLDTMNGLFGPPNPYYYPDQ